MPWCSHNCNEAVLLKVPLSKQTNFAVNVRMSWLFFPWKQSSLDLAAEAALLLTRVARGDLCPSSAKEVEISFCLAEHPAALQSVQIQGFAQENTLQPHATLNCCYCISAPVALTSPPLVGRSGSWGGNVFTHKLSRRYVVPPKSRRCSIPRCHSYSLCSERDCALK